MYSPMQPITRARRKLLTAFLQQDVVGIMEDNVMDNDDEQKVPSQKRRKRAKSLIASLAPQDDIPTEAAPTKRGRPSRKSNPDLVIDNDISSKDAQPVTKTTQVSLDPKTPTPRKTSTRKSPAKPILNSTPPTDWESIYRLVEELRQDRTAPVDSDGSEALPQRHRGDKVYRFQVLIALMLSSQTKDKVVGETMKALQDHGLDVENLSRTSSEKLNALIGKVGFHNNKTKYIQATVEILKTEYDGDIPSNANDMMKLPGVGPKMAFIVETVAWNKTSGIGVDTHMHRMFNELKWVNSKNPEQTRMQLEAWLPRELWPTVNVLWVGMGQEVQQFKPKILEKALSCSRPADALRLLKRLGVDIKKESTKLGVEDKVEHVMKAGH